MSKTVKSLKERLEQAVHLADMYREQCINAEEEASRIKDEVFSNKTMFQERTSKLVDKLELMTKVLFVRNAFSTYPVTYGSFLMSAILPLDCIFNNRLSACSSQLT